MKFQLLFIIGLVKSIAMFPLSVWDTVPEPRNSTLCISKHEKNILSCTDDIGEVIECPIQSKFDGLAKDLTVLGISRVEGLEKEDQEHIRYWLYPRKLDSSTYFDHITFVDGIQRDLVLYYGNEFTDFGIRVTNSSCYASLVDIFNKVSKDNNNNISSVSFIGEVLLNDKEIYKRWRRFGWGLGLGFNVFGW